MRNSVEIQFKYALSEAGDVIDIVCLSESDRKDYECAGCGKIVRPVLGKTRKKHFRHKISAHCSEETYLHRMGKMLFERKYKECQQHGRPFYVEFFQPVVCTHCKHGPCNVESLKRFDLTKAFTTLQNEQRDGNLIPDIFLQTTNGEILYIEIYVKHAATEQKINSGKKIIEIKVECEEDLELIESGLISCQDHRVKLYNFNPKVVEKAEPSLCQKEVAYFIVFPSGKCAIRVEPVYRFVKLLEDKKYYVKQILSRSGTVFIEEAEAAYNKGISVKNCFLCRYHALAKPYHRGNADVSIFCKFLKKTTASNCAAECKYYQADPKVFGEKRYERKNQVNRSQKKPPEPPSLKNFRGLKSRQKLSDSDNPLNSLLPENAKPYEFLSTCIFCGKVTADWWFNFGDGTCKCQSCKKKGS